MFIRIKHEMRTVGDGPNISRKFNYIANMFLLRLFSRFWVFRINAVRMCVVSLFFTTTCGKVNDFSSHPYNKREGIRFSSTFRYCMKYWIR